MRKQAKQISRLMDNELHGIKAQRALKSMMQDSQQQRYWARCHMISSVLRKRHLKAKWQALLPAQFTAQPLTFAQKLKKSLKRYAWQLILLVLLCLGLILLFKFT